MKKSTLQRWLPSVVLGVLAGSAGLCLAADTILVSTFDTFNETNGWSELTGNGVLAWDAGNAGGGGAGSGCLKVSLPAASGGTQVQPQIALGPKGFNSAQYWSISFDIKVDPSSGLSSDGATFGHWQVVLRNASWSWVGVNWSVLDTSYTNGWRHVELGFVQPYDQVSYIVFQVQGGPYAGDLTYYLDNIQINPLPFSILINAFTNASEVAEYSAWGATGSGISWVTTPDAGGLTPAGSMKLLANYDPATTGWQEGTCQRDFSFDPSRFTYFDMDVYLDPASVSPYGMVQVFLRQNHSPYNWLWIGNYGFGAADVGKWKHLSFPMAPTGETNSSGFVIQAGGTGLGGPVTFYYDNVRIWSPQTPPTITRLQPAGPGGGAVVTMDLTGAANQWQRDAIVTPSGTGPYTWYGYNGVTYSFTITNFPDAVAHPGFEAHMYFVNGDTCANEGWNETYGGVDWNANDIVVARLENNASGGVDFSFRYKTNLPNANVNNTVASVHCPSALGTWSVEFGADNKSVTLSGPSGVLTNFSLSQDVADKFNCYVSFLQFGVFKNDGAASGVNDGASATFSRVQMIGGGYPFDDTFPGPGLTVNYPWRMTSSSAVSWSPSGLAYWLYWSLPDDGFNPEVSGTVNGPYTDAGVTYRSVSGATRIGGVPATSVPAGNSAFFRLMKPPTP